MPPPPLPVARNPMIDSMAKVSLLVGVLWLLYALAQALLVTVLPDGAIAQMLLLIELRLPPLLQWCTDHLLALSWLSAALALAFCATSWSLLRRREWARVAFVVFLVLTALANFVSLPLLWEVFDALQAWLPHGAQYGADASELHAELRSGRIAGMFSAVLTCLVFAALHGWIVYLLYRPAVRAEFRT